MCARNPVASDISTTTCSSSLSTSGCAMSMICTLWFLPCRPPTSVRTWQNPLVSGGVNSLAICPSRCALREPLCLPIMTVLFLPRRIVSYRSFHPSRSCALSSARCAASCRCTSFAACRFRFMCVYAPTTKSWCTCRCIASCHFSAGYLGGPSRQCRFRASPSFLASSSSVSASSLLQTISSCSFSVTPASTNVVVSSMLSPAMLPSLYTSVATHFARGWTSRESDGHLWLNRALNVAIVMSSLTAIALGSFSLRSTHTFVSGARCVPPLPLPFCFAPPLVFVAFSFFSRPSRSRLFAATSAFGRAS